MRFGEPVWIDGRVVGYQKDGVFTQRITDRHIFRQYNAKGIDVSLYLRLKDECHTWRLIHKFTGQVLSILFDKIELVAEKMQTGVGEQYMVRLEDFNEDSPVVQSRLL